MLLMILSLVLLVSSLSVFVFAAELGIIRKELLNNLNKKFTSTTLAPIQPPPYQAQMNSFWLAGFDDNILRNVFKYFNKRDLDKVKTISKEFRSYSAVALAGILENICPHYVFSQNWLNELFYKFLEESDATKTLITEDQLEVINYNFIKLKNISRLKRLFIAFLYELIYGVGQNMPVDLKEWKHNLMRKLSKYSYNRAFVLYRNDLEADVDVEDQDWLAVTQHFALKLFNRFTQTELNELVDWNAPFFASVFTAVAPEITCAFIELTFSHLRHDEDRLAAMEFMFDNNSFSQQFWDYIIQYPHLLAFWVNTCDSRRWNRELEKKFTNNSAWRYLLTRTAAELFELEKFVELEIVEKEAMTMTFEEFEIKRDEMISILADSPNLIEQEISEVLRIAS